MSQFPQSQYDSTYPADRLRASDEARFLSAVYGWMTVGLVITAVVALFVATNQAAQEFVLGKPFVFFGLLIGELLLVMALSAGIGRMSAGTATFMFLVLLRRQRADAQCAVPHVRTWLDRHDVPDYGRHVRGDEPVWLDDEEGSHEHR